MEGSEEKFVIFHFIITFAPKYLNYKLMKRLFIQLNVAILLLLAVSFHCQGADNYTMKYNLEKGKTYKQHSITDMTMAMSAMGQDMKMNMTMGIDINYDVIDKSNEVYNIRMNYQRIKMDITSPTALSLDSDTPENSSDKNAAELLKSLVGVPLDIQLTEQGKVTSIKGVDSLISKINATGNPQFKQMFNQQFSENTIQKSIEQFSAYFPDKQVAIGDNWDITTTISSSGIDIINKMTLTLKQVSNNVATIEFTGTLATPEGGAVTHIQGMDAKVSVKGTQSGTIQLNLKTGWIVRSEIDQKFDQNIEVMGQTMPQQIETKTTVTGE